MPSMNSADWAREQRASIQARRDVLVAELTILSELDAALVKLLPQSDFYESAPTAPEKPKVQSLGAPKTPKAKPRRKSSDITPKVIKALEEGPMTIEQLQEKLNRRVKTGIVSILRVQGNKGTIVKREDGSYALPTALSSATPEVLVV